MGFAAPISKWEAETLTARCWDAASRRGMLCQGALGVARLGRVGLKAPPTASPVGCDPRAPRTARTEFISLREGLGSNRRPGLSTYVVAATSAGTEVGRITPPRPLERSLPELKTSQRAASRKQLGSKNRSDAVRVLVLRPPLGASCAR